MVQSGPANMPYLVSCRLGPYYQWGDYQWDSRRAFLFHTGLSRNNNNSGKKQMDLLVCYWSEVDSGVEI